MLISSLRGLKRLRETLKIYRTTYKNWSEVLLQLAITRKIRPVTRNSKIIEANATTIRAIAKKASMK